MFLLSGTSSAKGTAQYRRVLEPSVFLSSWSYVDHLVIQPGGTTAPHLHREVAEFYYVMNGDGTATVANESTAIHAGDAIPIQLNDAHSFENTGAKALEFLIVGVSRDNNRHIDSVELPVVRR